MSPAPRPARSLDDLFRENAIRAILAALGAAALWMWTSIAQLQDQVLNQEARVAALRDIAEARYLALRERTDASADELKRRIDRIDTQNTQIAVHVLEVMRTIARIESTLMPPRTPPASRE